MGYPIFLLPGLFFGAYLYHYAIAVQLLLNLGLAALFWRLFGRLGVGANTKVLFSVLFAMSSLGMAICVLSDFLGGLLFALFAYALLFKRSWWGVLLGSLCLAGSILVRPTFVFLVPIMPFVAYLAGRFAGRKLRLSHIGVYLAAGLLGILVNDGQERVFQDRLTPPGQKPAFPRRAYPVDFGGTFPPGHDGRTVVGGVQQAALTGSRHLMTASPAGRWCRRPWGC